MFLGAVDRLISILGSTYAIMVTVFGVGVTIGHYEKFKFLFTEAAIPVHFHFVSFVFIWPVIMIILSKWCEVKLKDYFEKLAGKLLLKRDKEARDDVASLEPEAQSTRKS